MEINGKEVQSLEIHKDNPRYKTDKHQVFIIGSKGIPANYGGFETFVEKLTECQISKKIRYHVACLSDNNMRFLYNGAKCFNIRVPDIGPAKAIYYDIAALYACVNYCKKRPFIQQPVFYVLACRIGPFIGYFKKEIKKIGGTLYVNPDGHEWKRAKWNFWIRRYWKWSEQLMVKHADLLICDSKNIEKYIQTEYISYHPSTTFIAYGTDTTPSRLSDNDTEYLQWMEEKQLSPKEYYLIVGRFVPENNFEIMIREFLRSSTEKSLVLITTDNLTFLERLEKKLHFKNDNRVKFVGTVYHQELLKKIRENAYAYLHGHEVGGTNPSLLEALGSTHINLLLDVGFNREVAEDAACYWNKDPGNLAALIDQVDKMPENQIVRLGTKAFDRMSKLYSWANITEMYEYLFENRRPTDDILM